MRILMLLLFVIPGMVLADNAGRVVFTYECATASLEKDGFRCLGMDGDTLKLEQADWSKVDKKKHAYFKYRFNLFLMRYFDLGGYAFEVFPAAGNDPVYLECAHSRRKNKYGYFCTRQKR